MPTNEITLESLDVNDNSDVTYCANCLESIIGDPYTIHTSPDETIPYCEQCFERQTNNCCSCDDTYPDNNINYCEDCEDYYCTTCDSDTDVHSCNEPTICFRCNQSKPNNETEQAFRLIGSPNLNEIINVCTNCNSNGYLQACEATYTKWLVADCIQLAKPPQSITRVTKNYYVNKGYYNTHQLQFFNCSSCHKTIWERIPGSYFNTRCADCYLNAATSPSIADSRFRILQDNWRSTVSSPRNDMGRGPANPEGRLNELSYKAKTTLQNNNRPTISSVHDKIYTGFEIECYGGDFAKCQTSYDGKGWKSYMGPNQALHLMVPKDTKIVSDGSIAGNNAWEFLPPVVKKEADWNYIKQLTEALNTMNWQVNNSCGLHYHFSHSKISPENPDLARKIFRLFYFIEPIIFSCLPGNRRKNPYCQPLKTFWNKKEIMQDLKLDYFYYGNFWKKKIRRENDRNGHPSLYDEASGEHVNFGQGRLGKKHLDTIKFQDHYFIGRYIGCNLHALFQKGTIELRYFPSSLNFTYIYSWGIFNKAIIQYAIDNGDLEKVNQIINSNNKTPSIIQQLCQLLKLPNSIADFLKNEYKKNLTNQDVTNKTTEVNQKLSEKIIEQIPIPQIPTLVSPNKKEKKIQQAKIQDTLLNTVITNNNETVIRISRIGVITITTNGEQRIYTLEEALRSEIITPSEYWRVRSGRDSQINFARQDLRDMLMSI